jgi:hypothetical protein
MGIDNKTIKLKPHHLIDVFKHLGNGHAQYELTREIQENPTLEIELVSENDDICKTCRHMGADNLCNDMFRQFILPIPKQIYNDELNKSLFKMLDMKPGHKITAVEFLEKILLQMPEIIPLATHPGESEKFTGHGLFNAGTVLKRNNKIKYEGEMMERKIRDIFIKLYPNQCQEFLENFEANLLTLKEDRDFNGRVMECLLCDISILNVRCMVFNFENHMKMLREMKNVLKLLQEGSLTFETTIIDILLEGCEELKKHLVGDAPSDEKELEKIIRDLHLRTIQDTSFYRVM